LEVELAGKIDGAFQIVARECRNTDASRNFGELTGGHGLVLGNRNGDDPAGGAWKNSQETPPVLCRQHAADYHYRPRHALLQIGKRGGNRLSAIDVMAAIEPDLAAWRRELGKPAMGKPLHARGPFHLNHGGFEG